MDKIEGKAMHTNEPWTIHPISATSVVGGKGFVVAACGGHSDNTRPPQDVHDELVSNARRIVACVNVCAGLDSDLLENIAMTGGLVERFALLNQTEQQRDELLAAAKNLRDVKGRYHSEQAMTKLLGVIIQIDGLL